MRKSKQAREYTTVPLRRLFRPEVIVCPTCQTRVPRYAPLSQRTGIILQGPIRLIHRGYRCPNTECATRMPSERGSRGAGLGRLHGSPLDMVILVGQLRLGQHQTLDEVHQELSRRLHPFAPL